MHITTTASMLATNRHQKTQLKHSILLLISRYSTKQRKHMLQNDTVVTEQGYITLQKFAENTVHIAVI
jgi:hypothetical protein